MALGHAPALAKGGIMTAPLAVVNPREADKLRPDAILVADDDPTMRLIVTQTLGDEFGPVVEAENGKIAVDRLSERAFRLAVVDLDMPVLDGFGVIANARAAPETRYLPIIVVTSRDDVVAIERAFALGATSFICKPLNWGIFRHQVRYVLEMARVTGETRRTEARAQFQSELRRAGMKAIEAAASRAAGDSNSDLAQTPDPLRHVAKRIARIRSACDIIAGDTAMNTTRESAASLLTEALEFAEKETGQTGRVSIGRGDPGVDCDRALAVKALAEILENSLAYTKGEVRVAMVPTGETGVRFEIADAGPGMGEAKLEAALRPFSGGGDDPALGIAIARAIVERHGGHFGVLSEPGGGTEAFLTF
jgi:two-component system, sensor histidine kinase and response regulator